MRIDFNKDPDHIDISWGKVVLWIFGLGIFVVIFAVIYGTCHTAATMVNNVQKTVVQEFSPSVLLKKYEWFKDAAAQLDGKIATINMYDSRFVSIKNTYGKDSLNRKAWDRDDKEQWNIWQSEVTGIKASYNTLAAEYNAAMAKFNYRFCNVGDLPQGQTVVLPREYKPYLTE